MGIVLGVHDACWHGDHVGGGEVSQERKREIVQTMMTGDYLKAEPRPMTPYNVLKSK